MSVLLHGVASSTEVRADVSGAPHLGMDAGTGQIVATMPTSKEFKQVIGYWACSCTGQYRQAEADVAVQVFNRMLPLRCPTSSRSLTAAKRACLRFVGQTDLRKPKGRNHNQSKIFIHAEVVMDNRSVIEARIFR